MFNFVSKELTHVASPLRIVYITLKVTFKHLEHLSFQDVSLNSGILLSFSYKFSFMGLHVVVNETDCPWLLTALIYRGIGKHGVLNLCLPILGSPRYENNHRGAGDYTGTVLDISPRWSPPFLATAKEGRPRRRSHGEVGHPRVGATRRNTRSFRPVCKLARGDRHLISYSSRPWVLISLHPIFTPLTSRPFSVTLSVKSVAQHSTLNNLRIPTPLTRHLGLKENRKSK